MKKLLLHSCCGPCSTHVIDVLRNQYDITVLYYNPNMDTETEYLHRLHEQQRFCQAVGVPVLEIGYCPEDFLSAVIGLEAEKEGGGRCSVCFQIRLQKTAMVAKEKGFDLFATTLTVSPHKNSIVINAIGKAVEAKSNIFFLDGNFKKQNGYQKSIELARQYDLYRQNYCGCKFSKREE